MKGATTQPLHYLQRIIILYIEWYWYMFYMASSKIYFSLKQSYWNRNKIGGNWLQKAVIAIRKWIPLRIPSPADDSGVHTEIYIFVYYLHFHLFSVHIHLNQEHRQKSPTDLGSLPQSTTATVFFSSVCVLSLSLSDVFLCDYHFPVFFTPHTSSFCYM